MARQKGKGKKRKRAWHRSRSSESRYARITFQIAEAYRRAEAGTITPDAERSGD